METLRNRRLHIVAIRWVCTKGVDFIGTPYSGCLWEQRPKLVSALPCDLKSPWWWGIVRFEEKKIPLVIVIFWTVSRGQRQTCNCPSSFLYRSHLYVCVIQIKNIYFLILRKMDGGKNPFFHILEWNFGYFLSFFPLKYLPIPFSTFFLTNQTLFSWGCY